jgi:hypothetical protein
MSTHSYAPSGHPHVAAREKRGIGARLTAALLLLLGFGFTASALVESPTGAQHDRSRLVARSISAEPAAVGDPASVRAPEVDLAIASWTAETPAERRPPQGSYDWEELWLPR